MDSIINALLLQRKPYTQAQQSPSQDDELMEITYFSLIASACTFLVGLLGVALPLVMSRAKWFAPIQIYADCLSAGIILGGALLHMSPESMHTFEHYGKITYPLPMVIFSGVALLLLCIDKFMHSHSSFDHHHHQSGAEEHQDHVIEAIAIHTVDSTNTQSSTAPFELAETSSTVNASVDERDPTIQANDGDSVPTATQLPATIVASTAPVHEKPMGKLRDAVTPHRKYYQSVSFVSAMVFLIALSMHSCLEGLGVGSAATLANSIVLFVAVISHKFFESFALGLRIQGVTFSKITTNCGQMIAKAVLAIAYSLATPVGILVGLFAVGYSSNGDGETHALVSSILTAMAGGSFLYVGAFEIMPHVLQSPHRMFLKLCLLLLGWGFMAAMAALDIHHH